MLSTLTVTDVSAEELNSLPKNSADIRAREGVLFRDPNNGAIYIIDEISPGSYQKRHVTAAGWSAYFAPCGDYPFTNVDQAYLDGYANGPDVSNTTLRPDGQLIKSDTSSAVYFLENGQKRWITSSASLASYNFEQPVCVAPVWVYPTGPNLRAREGTLAKDGGPWVYIIDHAGGSTYYKRHITSMDSFSYYGFTLDLVRTWSGSEVGSYSTGAHAHPYKTLFSDQWYKSLVSNDLTMHRLYGAGIPSSGWDPAITAARDDWNNTATAVDFLERGPDVVNDVYVDIDNYVWEQGGRMTYMYENGRVRHAWVQLNHARTASWYRQSLTAHELGHAVGLAHDGMSPGDERDFVCGVPRVPQTIMDYDCSLDGYINGPVAWDSCGVNHKHFDPAWGWSGC